MLGKLLNRDKDGDGIVATPGGDRYQFWRSDVLSEKGLRSGAPVEFDVEGSRAVAIRRHGAARQSSPIVLIAVIVLAVAAGLFFLIVGVG